MSDEKLFSIKEVAEYLGCDQAFVQRKIKSGELAASQLSTRRLIRVRQTDLDAFIDSRRVKTGKQP